MRNVALFFSRSTNFVVSVSLPFVPVTRSPATRHFHESIDTVNHWQLRSFPGASRAEFSRRSLHRPVAFPRTHPSVRVHRVARGTTGSREGYNVGNAMEHRGGKETMRQIAQNDVKRDVTEIDEAAVRAAVEQSLK